MTDPRPDSPRDPLPDQLSGWFDREVRQAAADLRAAPLGSARVARRSAGPAIAPLAAVAVVVIAVVAGLTRLPGLTPGVEPTGSGSPAASLGGSAKSTIPAPTASLPALTVDSRYADGIPSSLGGRNVFRVSDLYGAPSGDGSFLLGGWILDWKGVAVSCPIQIGTPPPFGPVCGTPYLMENPLTDELPRVPLDGWTPAIPAGPVVRQVHRHDPRASTCLGDNVNACQNVAVIEGLLWAGDATTATTPLEPIDTFMRLMSVDPNLPQADLMPEPYPGQLVPPNHFPAFLNCRPPYPDQAWAVLSTTITSVLVFPTVDAREAADQDLTASGFIGTSDDGGSCVSTTDSAFSRRWVAVDNVMVSVLVKIDGPTAAQARFIDEVRAALTR